MAEQRAAADDPGEGPVGPALTACVVEDQVALREWLVALLTQHDVVVTAAVGTVNEAELVIPALEPDVAIIDNGLPDGRGIDLCGVLARTTPGTVLILHTGLVSVEEEREAARAGASAVVLKSIRGRELVDLLGTLTPGRRRELSP